MKDIIVMILSFNVFMLFINAAIFRYEINKLEKRINHLEADIWRIDNESNN